MTNKQQMELYDLLEKQLERYTKGESSAVSVEIAQKLLMSMEYCMNSYYKALEDGEPYGVDPKMELASDEEAMEVILEKGIKLVNGCVDTSKELWKKVKNNMIHVDNITYEKTILEEIPKFFDSYDPQFGAQLTPITLTYPLAVNVKKLQGVEYIYEYLYRLELENEFVHKFPLDKIHLLYQDQKKVLEDDRVNLFELVLQNAIGLYLLGKDVYEVNVTAKACEQLEQLLSKLSIAKLHILIDETIEALLSMVSMEQQDMIKYTQEKGKDIARRIDKNRKQKTLSYLFVEFIETKDKTATYFEGERLSKEKLSEVIDELYKMQYLKNKLDYVQEKIHSLDDFIKVLGECFAGEEYEQVFSLLLPSEKKLLLIQAQTDLELYQDENVLKEWERLLLELEADKEIKDESRNGI